MQSGCGAKWWGNLGRQSQSDYPQIQFTPDLRHKWIVAFGIDADPFGGFAGIVIVTHLHIGNCIAQGYIPQTKAAGEVRIAGNQVKLPIYLVTQLDLVIGITNA